MNVVAIVGRLTKEPEMKNNSVAKYTLAVDRKFKRDGQPTADFINCVAFGRQAEFVQKYLHKGTKIGLYGHIQTGSYKAQDGRTVYTTEVVAEEHYFMENKAQNGAQGFTDATTSSGGNRDDSFADAVQSELPFD